MIKNLPRNAGNTGSTSGQGIMIPYAPEQLSLCMATTELVCSGAPALQLENPCKVVKDPAGCSKDLLLRFTLVTVARVQPQLIQGIRRRDGVGEGQGTTA